MDEYTNEALDLAKAQAGVRNMTEGEIGSMVQTVTQRLREIESQSAGNVPSQAQEPAVDPKKAIREKSVVCLECGKTFKVLSKRHLAQHGLTTKEYKEKWGIKKNQSLTAKALSRQRKQKMQEMQIWKNRG